ncbi:hypothetical protein [Spirulina sp. 06S082]|uniref:hypothetical protein n=1 Tax=Spirulina sp. 06S082 TaxID=3110248 RepID=UPI002B21D5B5|nr:hypothetical protein [Spirulina sp. 06S082]MEA5470243.1 hypothetical protein [Spirulina sp. 06S082]
MESNKTHKTLDSVREVTKVLFPFLVQSPFPEEFRVGAIVESRGRYGTIAKMDESDRPITIVWDAKPGEETDKFAYTRDEIRFHNISVVSPYREGQTWVEFPLGTKVELADGGIIELGELPCYWVETVDQESIVILDRSGLYRFPFSLFPGSPFKNQIELPDSLPLPQLSVTDLRTRAEIWLSLNSPSQLLEIITPTWQQQLKEKFTAQLDESYQPEDFETAWENAFANHLQKQGEEEGICGFKIGSRVLERGKRWGAIASLDPHSERTFGIRWNDEMVMHYSQLEMKAMGILLVPPAIALSSNVAYEMSEDGSYYRAFIAFRTKKLARAWLKSIKQLVGKLSNLHDHQLPEFRHLAGKRWEYEIEKPKHK